MSKQIVRNQDVYIAPGILGRYENDSPVAIDERNDEIWLDPTNIDDKITIYEREVNEWFLNRASDLLHSNGFENSFIVLMICMSYIEGVEQYKTGVSSKNRSNDCFVDSINRIYPDAYRTQHLKKLYSKIRCGLFHNGMVKGGVIFNHSLPDPIKFSENGENIWINPSLLLQNLKDDFSNYITELRSNNLDESTVLRGNFDRMFNVTEYLRHS